MVAIRKWMTAMGLALVAVAAVAVPGKADAFEVELNKLEQAGPDCRVYLLLRNGPELSYDQVELDLVFFDRDGVIDRRLLVDLGAVRSDKMQVNLFDLSGSTCTELGRVLLNDVPTCQIGGAAEPATDCVEAIEPTARGDVAFVK